MQKYLDVHFFWREGGIKNNWFEEHYQYLSIVVLNLRLRKIPPIL